MDPITALMILIPRRSLGTAPMAVLLALLTLPLALPAQQTLKGHLLTDKAAGFKLSFPKEWEQLPIHVDERRVLAWFHSRRRFRGDLKAGESTKGRHSSLQVIRLDKPWTGKGPKRKRWDYAEWLLRSLKVNTYEATKVSAPHRELEIVKWDVRVAGPGIDRLRILTWVFPRDKHDLAVQCQVLEHHLARQRPLLESCLESFRLIDAVVSDHAALTAKKKPFALRQWLELPLLERRRQRATIETAHEKRMLSLLPAGWTSQRSKYFLILSHADAKITRQVRDTADAFGKWLRDKFGPLSDLLPMRTTLRICKNPSEYHAYRKGSWRADYNFADREVILCNDRGKLNLQDALWAVFRRYMLDVAPEVYFNMPAWLHQGMKSLVGRARLKGRKLHFPPSRDEASLYDRLRRGEDSVIHTARELMTHADLGYTSAGSKHDTNIVLEASALVRFFDGPARRCKPVGKQFLLHYMQQLQQLVRELDADDPKVLVWDDEDAITARLQAELEAGDQPVVPRLASRWDSYLKTVRERRESFLRTLQRRACGWSVAERETMERAFARSRSGR